MKKMIIVSTLALGLMFATLGKGICVSCTSCGSTEAGGAISLLILAGNNPFGGITSGVNAILGDFFGPNLRESMSAMLMGSPFLASMESAMTPFGGKQTAQGPGLQNEFASLNLNTLGLDGQVASGSSKTWISLTASELNALQTDAQLAGMSGF